MGYGGSGTKPEIRTPISNDRGIDGIVYQDALGLDKIYIQAKRYSTNKVGINEINSFIGAMLSNQKGVFFTTT